MTCLLLDMRHHLTGSSALDALDLNQVFPKQSRLGKRRQSPSKFKISFVEDVGPFEKPVDILDSETESVNISSVHPKQLIITQVDSEVEEEEEQMDQKKRPGLKGLLSSRNKGGSSKEAPKTQPPVIPPPPPLTDLGLLAMPNLKKRR